MTRAELFRQLADEKDIPLYLAEQIVTEILDGMAESLVAGDRIEIRGFGSFEIREYEGYTGKNPKSGKKVAVKPKKLPFFKVGKELKDRIMAGGGV